MCASTLRGTVTTSREIPFQFIKQRAGLQRERIWTWWQEAARFEPPVAETLPEEALAQRSPKCTLRAALPGPTFPVVTGRGAPDELAKCDAVVIGVPTRSGDSHAQWKASHLVLAPISIIVMLFSSTTTSYREIIEEVLYLL
ncbi:hypothetical protein C8J57DRAFT_1237028 [Mycena rebaudengoi]|nr:hypothetical protein C8J57DRAFT_1237028 [Mycena rebaudengoi]